MNTYLHIVIIWLLYFLQLFDIDFGNDVDLQIGYLYTNQVSIQYWILCSLKCGFVLLSYCFTVSIIYRS